LPFIDKIIDLLPRKDILAFFIKIIFQFSAYKTPHVFMK